ncbi:Argininosuccinate lyase [hydrothermal vent metagenome]|uniref:Argininosuccinate lyase n=1 Tax=hydrothermal vent metagenome TaxID=652676 RepID=A0A1W1BVS8_9ZZZZ
MTQNNLANAYSDRIKGDRASNLESAISHYNLALEIYTKEKFPARWATTQNSLANAYMKSGKYKKAIECYEDTLEQNQNDLAYESILPSYKREKIEKTQGIWGNLAWAYLSVGDYKSSFVALERGRSREAKLKYNIDKAIASISKDKREKMIEKVKELRVEERYLAIDQHRSTKRYKELSSYIQKELEPIFDKDRYDANTTIKDIERLPISYAIVAPLMSEYGNAIFIIKGGSKTIDRDSIVDSALSYDDTAKLAKKFLNDVYVAGEVNSIDEIIERLSDTVAKDISDRLASLSVDHILYLPSPYLSYLPLGSCRCEDTLLMQRYEFITLSNLYNLHISKERRAIQKDSKLLAIINPTSDLNSTEVEGAVVEDMFSHTRAIRHSEATKSKILKELSKPCDIFYYSGHAYSNITGKREGGFRLKDANLTINDIISSSIDMNSTKLVVLSACQTNMRDISILLESASLADSFLELGSRGVISTLWSVSDDASMLLMGKFFELYRDGNSVAKALASAQIWLKNLNRVDAIAILKRYKKGKSADIADKLNDTIKELEKTEYNDIYNVPYYWAGFVYSARADSI